MRRLEHVPSDWLIGAACHEADPGLFFPGADQSAVPALRVCAACPVRMPCLDHALTLGETSGIWGGMTSAGRRRLMRAGA